MRDLDKDGRLLCELQGKIFEKSAEEYGTSSAVFIRRFMNSDYAARLDNNGAADRPTDARDAFDSLNEEFGESQYGSRIFLPDELFWIGYVYRCWSYVYELPSRTIYKICNASEMHSVYYAFHTLDPLSAAERIMEAKGFENDEDKQLKTAVSLLREIGSLTFPVVKRK